MELRALQSPAFRGTPALIHTGLRDKPFVSGKPIKIPNSKKTPIAGKLKLLNSRVQALASSGIKAANSDAVDAILKDGDAKDEGLAFVAGATGRVGSRTVRELLKLGFRVKAGVRSIQRAESLVQSVQQMKLDDGTQSIKKLEIVECDLEKRDRIKLALGNASVVICCIGASEKEVLDITGPYRIDYLATKNLVDAATSAKVNHFILVTSLGTNKFGFPAAILNLFWGVLIWKRKAEVALLASGLPFTIVRPGGMERPTDAYKETHNIYLSEQDTLFGGQVSNLQVAELIAFMAKNRSLSYCKVVEVIAETTAPLTPMGELLTKIPSERVEITPLKETDAATPSQSIVSKSGVSNPISPLMEKEPSTEGPVTARPLSPYSAYEDLKPPTSPTPTPSSSTGTAKAGLTFASASVNEKEAEQTELKKQSPLSPYTKYNDLGHPTASSPNAPAVDGYKTVTLSGNSTPKPEDTDLPESEKHGELKPRPLSPYTMYEDLKPPSSPTPTQS